MMRSLDCDARVSVCGTQPCTFVLAFPRASVCCKRRTSRHQARWVFFLLFHGLPKSHHSKTNTNTNKKSPTMARTWGQRLQPASHAAGHHAHCIATMLRRLQMLTEAMPAQLDALPDDLQMRYFHERRTRHIFEKLAEATSAVEDYAPILRSLAPASLATPAADTLNMNILVRSLRLREGRTTYAYAGEDELIRTASALARDTSSCGELSVDGESMTALIEQI